VDREGIQNLVKGEQDASLFFDVLPLFVLDDDIEVIGTCFHEHEVVYASIRRHEGTTTTTSDFEETVSHYEDYVTNDFLELYLG